MFVAKWRLSHLIWFVLWNFVMDSIEVEQLKRLSLAFVAVEHLQFVALLAIVMF